MYIEVVHRLSNLGAVITQATYASSRHGFEAEWRENSIFTFDGDLVSRCELFDEDDLDAALDRFDRLGQPAPRLENAASQIADRFLAHFAAGNWDAMADVLADNLSAGRGAQVANLQAIAELWSTNVTRSVIAARGRDLVLVRITFTGRGEGVEAFLGEVLMIVEIDLDEKLASMVTFDLDDFDAAIAELDARYLAGEAAAHARTWSSVMQAQAAWNRHELFPNIENWVNIDHRRGRAYEQGELKAFLRATWNVVPDVKLHGEAVHRLTNAGVVSTVVATGTSQEGFDAEWREICLVTFDGDLLSRCELFDEADLDAALFRFDELQPRTRRLENAATKVTEPYWKHYAAREWAAMAELVARDISTDDRRRVVNVGIRRGRDEHMADMRSVAEVFPDLDTTTAVMATRGARLVLTRIRFLSTGMEVGELITEVVRINEIDADDRIVSGVAFDIEDVGAAIAELDARYLAGEAAAYPDSWSAITQTCAALNRLEMPRTASNFVDVDHRKFAAIAPGELITYLRAGLKDMVDNILYVEAVHRLTALGGSSPTQRKEPR